VFESKKPRSPTPPPPRPTHRRFLAAPAKRGAAAAPAAAAAGSSSSRATDPTPSTSTANAAEDVDGATNTGPPAAKVPKPSSEEDRPKGTKLPLYMQLYPGITRWDFVAVPDAVEDIFFYDCHHCAEVYPLRLFKQWLNTWGHRGLCFLHYEQYNGPCKTKADLEKMPYARKYSYFAHFTPGWRADGYCQQHKIWVPRGSTDELLPSDFKFNSWDEMMLSGRSVAERFLMIWFGAEEKGCTTYEELCLDMKRAADARRLAEEREEAERKEMWSRRIDSQLVHYK